MVKELRNLDECIMSSLSREFLSLFQKTLFWENRVFGSVCVCAHGIMRSGRRFAVEDDVLKEQDACTAAKE